MLTSGSQLQPGGRGVLHLQSTHMSPIGQKLKRCSIQLQQRNTSKDPREIQFYLGVNAHVPVWQKLKSSHNGQEGRETKTTIRLKTRKKTESHGQS